MSVTRRQLLINLMSYAGLASVNSLLRPASAFPFSPTTKKLGSVNDTDIASAIMLGCQTMSNVFNADDNNIPFFESIVGDASRFGFNDSHSESHVPGRHLNALLNAENALNYKIAAGIIEKHTAAAFFAYSGAIPLPLNRAVPGGKPIRFLPHNIREGFHALYALVKFRNSAKARKLAEESIAFIFQHWEPSKGWQRELIEGKYGVKVIEWQGPFITGIARAIGPLVKYYKATGYGKALELAIVLKEKALEDYFSADGHFDINRFGTHTHSTTCVLSSLAQLAEVTADAGLMERVKAFFDNGLKEISNEIGWSVENCNPNAAMDRGEANNTGDILETALILGKWGYTDYYQQAERILRAHLLPCQLRDVSFIKEPYNPNKEDNKVNVAQRHKGAFGFPAPYGHKPVNEKDISFNMDIVGGVVGSLCEAYREIYRKTATGHQVNLLFDHETETIKVRSPYTNGRLQVMVKTEAPLYVRIPSWVKNFRLASLEKVPFRLTGNYLFIASPPLNQWIIIPFDLISHDIELNYGTRKIIARLSGDRVTAMENFGAELTYFDSL